MYIIYTLFFIKKKRLIINKLIQQKIQTRIIYPFPIHKMKIMQYYLKKDKHSVSEITSKGIFSLPLYPELSLKKS